MEYVIREKKNPRDPTQDAKFYPVGVYSGNVSTEAFAQEVADMCTLTPMDVLAVLRCFLSILPKYLMDGKVIDLENFGRLKLYLKAKGSATADLVDPSKVQSFNVRFLSKPKLKQAVMNTPLVAFVDKTNAGWSN